MDATLAKQARPLGALHGTGGLRAPPPHPLVPARHSTVAAAAAAAAAPPTVDPSLPPDHARAAVAAAKRRARSAAGAEEAAAVLGDFLGLGRSGLGPAATVNLDKDQVLGILEAAWRRGDQDLERALYGHAAAVTSKFCGGNVFYRGLVEFSNICQNDCGYCGIRNNQKDVWRYTMPEEEVVEVAKWALENGIRNVMLQSGELHTPQRLEYLERVVRAIRAETVAIDRALIAAGHPNAPKLAPEALAGDAESNGDAAPGDEGLGVAVSLSVGELPVEDYERLFRAGARRYLIRIETSNPELYAALHPAPLSWHHRVDCLKALKKLGYMLGTGGMIGLPGQTLADLAGDVLFFKEVQADMIGMGPFITQPGTPATDKWLDLYPNANKASHMKSMFELTTMMNALVRITMGNVNISATTAMQAIVPTGRELALERGANVVMPILTPTKYRESYQLYEGKPCITDTAVQCRRCLDMRLHSVGKTSAAGIWGDPASYLHPVVGLDVPHDATSAALQAAAEANMIEQGATPQSPIPLRRLVPHPADLDVPPPSYKGHGRSGAKAAHSSHDDGDSHHHGHDHAPAATPAAPAGVAAAAGGGGQRPLLHGALPVRGTLLAGRARVAASPLRPAAAARGRGAVACAAAAPSAPAAPAAGGDLNAVASTTAHGVPRLNIGVFGVMNAGKSTLVNALTQQEACIVDATPGTTADVKPLLLELHALGPAKVLDTAGLDEEGALGEKKRRKALNALKECDVAVVVVDTDNVAKAKAQPGYSLSSALQWEKRVMEQANKYGVSPLLLLNVKGPHQAGSPEVEALLAEVTKELDPALKVPTLAMDLTAATLHERATRVTEFVQIGAMRSPRFGKPLPGCLPRWALGKGSMLLMVIPMDAETPTGRLLRPQAMVMEEAIRHWATVLSVRLDLDAARGKLGPEAQEAERQRFGGVIKMLEDNAGPVLVVTDSQAVDVVHPWTLDRASGRPLVAFTTFSISMAYQQSGGHLDKFIDGLDALESLKPGDRILVAEACNHNRITEACNDIGMVQIPNKLEKMMGGGKLVVDHAYGREFPDLDDGTLSKYKVVLHCGGCMIDTQKMQQRLADLREGGVPFTNYGIFFSWAAAPEALRRALEPWGLEPPMPARALQQQQGAK